MNRRFGRLFSTSLAMGFIGLLVLMGCDRSLKGNDLISPTADARITAVRFESGSILAPFVGAIQGTEATTPVTAVAYSDAQVEVTIFNGINVTFNRFMVEYYLEDGMTPLGIAPYRGFLQQFVLGGYPSASDFTSIDPAQTPTGVKVGGILGKATIRIPAVTIDLQEFMAGPDHIFGTADDYRGTVVGVMTVYGEDMNAHDIQISSRFAISSRIPVVSQGD